MSFASSSFAGRPRQPKPLSPLSSNATVRSFAAYVSMCLAVRTMLKMRPRPFSSSWRGRPDGIRKPESLGPWLHGVACRVARRAKSESGRRRVAERKKAEIRHERANAKSGPEIMDCAELHEAIDRLPEKYRQPIILSNESG